MSPHRRLNRTDRRFEELGGDNYLPVIRECYRAHQARLDECVHQTVGALNAWFAT